MWISSKEYYTSRTESEWPGERFMKNITKTVQTAIAKKETGNKN
jgi:hypothetical protein